MSLHEHDAEDDETLKAHGLKRVRFDELFPPDVVAEVLAPDRYNPYAEMEQRHRDWMRVKGPHRHFTYTDR